MDDSLLLALYSAEARLRGVEDSIQTTAFSTRIDQSTANSLTGYDTP